MAPRSWTLPPSLADQVEKQLAGVVDPCSTASVLSMSIVELGLIKDVTLDDRGVLTVYLRLTSPSCMMVGYIAREVVGRLSNLPGVAEVRVAPDDGLEWDPSMMDADLGRERDRRLVLLDIRHTDQP